jgi:hypothetical protein
MVMTVSAASSPSVPGGGDPKNNSASGISAVSSNRLPSSRASSESDDCSMVTTSSNVEVSSAGTCRTAWRNAVAVDASRATCGGTSMEQMSCTSIRRSARALETAMPNSCSPAGVFGKCARCGVGMRAYGASVPCSEPVRLSTRENGRSSGIEHSRASGPDGSSRVTCTPRRAAR